MLMRIAFPLATVAILLTQVQIARTTQDQPGTVDFQRDVQPILRQSCYACHGPTQQMNGFRLDRRSDAMRGGTATMIGPGNAQGSRLYQRLIGNEFGQQMPPTGPLSADRVGIIKAWIDQGAKWPDAAAGEVPTPPADPVATRLIGLLREGDLRAFAAESAKSPHAIGARGPGGSTPLMYAALHADAATLGALLEGGADPNVKNDAGATALMWAVADLPKTRLLVDRGADVNARSHDGRTPLMIAAGFAGASPVVKFLLERGARVNASGTALVGEITALTEAAIVGDEATFKLLVSAGADLQQAGPAALGLSFRSACMSCADTLLKALPRDMLTATMMLGAPPLGPALGTPLFLERGADASVKDPSGRTMLLLAAASETMPVDAVKALLGRQLDINYQTAKGETALSLARRHGRTTPIVDLLLKAGAKDDGAAAPAKTTVQNNTSTAAVERALPLLQKTDAAFFRKSGCVSCHNNSLTAIVVATSRTKGFAVNETIAQDQHKKIGAYLHTWRERALQGIGIPGDTDTASYILLGLAADGYPADDSTAAQAYFIRRAQSADGRWRILANRPPIESSDIQVTALAMRSLQLYAPKASRAVYERSIAAAAAWLASAKPQSNEDRVFQLLGLSWSRAPQSVITAAGRALTAQQRSDGGWGQIQTLDSDAYATGQALYALVQSGALTPADAAYRRGAAFLLNSQLADGSWFVPTRAIPLQPLFDADFPHGADAFISAAATGWATAALALAPRNAF